MLVDKHVPQLIVADSCAIVFCHFHGVYYTISLSQKASEIAINFIQLNISFIFLKLPFLSSTDAHPPLAPLSLSHTLRSGQPFRGGDNLAALRVHGGELAPGLDEAGVDEKFDPVQRLASLRKRDGVLGDVVAPREGIASLREVCADGRAASQKLCGKHRLLLPQIAAQFNNVQGEDSRLRLEYFGSFSCHYLIAFLLDVLPYTSGCWQGVLRM